MQIVLPAIAVAFAAFGVWLTVRIVNRRERWAKWLAVGLVVVLAYPLSFGPACRMADRGFVPATEIERAYRPIVAWMLSDNMALSGLILRYAVWCGGEMTVIGFIESHSRASGRVMH